MNSSISGSDARRWRGVLRRYAVATAAVGLIVAALVLALDPYDTGRFALLPASGVPDFGQRLSFASIARRPDIDGAILGNSTIQLLDPARLSALSRRQLVSLAVPGSGPREQLAIADWFRRRHSGADLTLVFGLDMTWCTTEQPIPLAYPFPFWLYDRSRIDYALNMMRYKSLEAALRKLKLLLGRERVAASDGYHDYDTGHVYRAPAFESEDAAAQAPAPPGTDFSAPPLLETFLAQLGPGAKLMLVMVPRHARTLPRAPADMRQLDACKARYRAIAGARPGTAFLDFLVDSAMTRADENFWDGIHYRGAVARALEQQIASALGR
jgi:hypothetical protein